MLLQQYPIEQDNSCKHSTKKVSNCKFWHCQKIGRYFARVPTKSSNLFLLVKSQGFCIYVYQWLLVICTLIC